MPTKSIVVPSNRSVNGLACIRSLRPRGIHTICVSEHENDPAFASRYCDEAVVVPSPFDDVVAYKDALLTLASRPDVRTIIPALEVDAYVLSRHLDAFEEHVSTVIPSFEKMRVVQDKLRLSEVAREAGVAVPETHVLDDVENWDRRQVVKSRFSVITEEYVDSLPPTALHMYKSVQLLDNGSKPNLEGTLVETAGHSPIVQEYIPASNEYLVGAVYDEGEPVTTFQQRYLRRESYGGGGSVYRESVDIPELEAAGRRLLDYMDWHGLACVEFMRHAETGEFVLTEINPRIWNSIPCAVRAGADFPFDYWRLSQDEHDHDDSTYRVGVATHQLYGEFRHSLSVLTEEHPFIEKPKLRDVLYEQLKSLVTNPRFDYLTFDDVRPFVSGLLIAASSVSSPDFVTPDQPRIQSPEDSP